MLVPLYPTIRKNADLLLLLSHVMKDMTIYHMHHDLLIYAFACFRKPKIRKRRHIFIARLTYARTKSQAATTRSIEGNDNVFGSCYKYTKINVMTDKLDVTSSTCNKAKQKPNKSVVILAS